MLSFKSGDEMDREKLIKHFEHLLNDAKGNYQDFVDLTVDAGEEILELLKEQEAEISFLKGMQLKTIHNMSEEDIGDAVAEILRLKGR